MFLTFLSFFMFFERCNVFKIFNFKFIGIEMSLNCFQISLNESKCVWMSLKVSEWVWMRPNESIWVWMCLNKFEWDRKSPNELECVQMSSNESGCVHIIYYNSYFAASISVHLWNNSIWHELLHAIWRSLFIFLKMKTHARRREVLY